MSVTLKTRKSVNELTESDLATFPVWEYCADEEEVPDETYVRPVDSRFVPLDAFSLSVAATFKTSSGKQLKGLIDVSTYDGVEMGHAALLLDGRRLFLPSPRYATARTEYAKVVAALGMPPKEVFPMRYTLDVPIERQSDPPRGILPG